MNNMVNLEGMGELDLGLAAIMPLPLVAEAGRDLTPEDLLVAQSTKLGSKSQHLKKVRAVHHQAAQLMAAGTKNVEISNMTGLCISRLSILQNDPAFTELLTFYQDKSFENHSRIQERLTLLGIDAITEIHERVIETPELVSTKVLLEITDTTLDRTGHSRIQKTESKSLNVHLSSDELDDIKNITKQSQRGTILDGAIINVTESEGTDISVHSEHAAPGTGTEKT